MKRTVLSILAASATAIASAQTAGAGSAPAAPTATGSSPLSIAIINSQRLALESAPGKGTLIEAILPVTDIDSPDTPTPVPEAIAA